MAHVSKTTPLLGVICHPLARLDIVSLCKKNLRALASAIPEIWMGHPKFTSSSAVAEGPRDAFVSKNSATTKYRYRVALFV